jgi:hypothetical protein
MNKDPDSVASAHYHTRLLSHTFGVWVAVYLAGRKELEEAEQHAMDHQRLWLLQRGLYGLIQYKKRDHVRIATLGYVMFFMMLQNKGLKGFKTNVAFQQRIHTPEAEQQREERYEKLHDFLLYKDLFQLKKAFRRMFARSKRQRANNTKLIQKFYLNIQEAFQTLYTKSLTHRPRERKEIKIQQFQTKWRKIRGFGKLIPSLIVDLMVMF